MLIREGLYRSQITETQWSSNSKQTGHYLKITFTIESDPEFAGKTISHYFNFDNPSEFAVKKAHEAWIKLCTAANLGPLACDWKKGPSDEIKKKLYCEKVSIDIAHRAGENGYTNYEIKNFAPYNKVVQTPPAETKAPVREEAPPIDLDDLNDDIPF